MTISEHLVTVVIPAFNARSTIDETLRSVRSQSHEKLEIIVVDDGSTDGTSAVVREHALIDPRVRLVTQENAGVAAARNTGWRSAQSEFVAFIDADDLWAPRNIERQLEALLAAGRNTGLVYSWYALIDVSSRIRTKSAPVYFSGDVLNELFEGNFIGNGSAILVRRESLLSTNGFESGLHARGAQGCEDLLFYCRVAENFRFAVVPEYLVGYRYSPDNMSSDMPRMLRSWLIVMDEMEGRYPDRRGALTYGLRNYGGYLLHQATTKGRFGYFLSILVLLIQRDPLLGIKVLSHDLPRSLVRAIRRRLEGERDRVLHPTVAPFPIGDPG